MKQPLNLQIEKDGKTLRCGYTTGSCAAAAAKAAVHMLFQQRSLDQVSIDLPNSGTLDLRIEQQNFSTLQASCCVIKDAGDDPDITDGIEVFATATPNQTGKVQITGGVGVGMITRPGLRVQPGNPAINPVPMSMILREVGKELPENVGVTVEISAPAGVEIAKKTYNPRLGIVGGISILGTSGIVVPMSEEALKASLELNLKQLAAEGAKSAIFVPGNYGRDYCRDQLNIDERYLITTSNFAGFMLKKAAEFGFEKILWVGNVGKLVKLAAGIFHTHSHVADGRMETLASNLLLECDDLKLLRKVMLSNTTEEAVQYIHKAGLNSFFDCLSDKITQKSEAHVHGEISVASMIFSMDLGKLGQSKNFNELLKTVPISGNSEQDSISCKPAGCDQCNDDRCDG